MGASGQASGALPALALDRPAPATPATPRPASVYLFLQPLSGRPGQGQAMAELGLTSPRGACAVGRGGAGLVMKIHTCDIVLRGLCPPFCALRLLRLAQRFSPCSPFPATPRRRPVGPSGDSAMGQGGGALPLPTVERDTHIQGLGRQQGRTTSSRWLAPRPAAA